MYQSLQIQESPGIIATSTNAHVSEVAQMSTIKYYQRLILKACYQFYRLGLSQTEIAEKLGVSRFQVARMLRAALEDGYVVVKILEPEHWHSDLEQTIEVRYGLKTVIVVD